jgi:hypothetical protein
MRIQVCLVPFLPHLVLQGKGRMDHDNGEWEKVLEEEMRPTGSNNRGGVEPGLGHRVTQCLSGLSESADPISHKLRVHRCLLCRKQGPRQQPSWLSESRGLC